MQTHRDRDYCCNLGTLRPLVETLSLSSVITAAVKSSDEAILLIQRGSYHLMPTETLPAPYEQKLNKQKNSIFN